MCDVTWEKTSNCADCFCGDGVCDTEEDPGVCEEECEERLDGLGVGKIGVQLSAKVLWYNFLSVLCTENYMEQYL